MYTLPPNHQIRNAQCGVYRFTNLPSNGVIAKVVTLTYIFMVKIVNNRLPVPADLPPLVRHALSDCSCEIEWMCHSLRNTSPIVRLELYYFVNRIILTSSRTIRCQEITLVVHHVTK